MKFYITLASMFLCLCSFNNNVQCTEINNTQLNYFYPKIPGYISNLTNNLCNELEKCTSDEATINKNHNKYVELYLKYGLMNNLHIPLQCNLNSRFEYNDVMRGYENLANELSIYKKRLEDDLINKHINKTEYEVFRNYFDNIEHCASFDVRKIFFKHTAVGIKVKKSLKLQF